MRSGPLNHLAHRVGRTEPVMRVYKFLSCKYGLKVLRERRLKISEVRSLNDPFELLPIDLSDPELRKGTYVTRQEIGKKYGLLCFSMHWHNPVLWAHYADSHKGMCLGFDLPDIGPRVMKYVDRPITLTDHDLANPDEETVNKMLFTKYDHWRYEEEIRLFQRLEERSGDYYFENFSDEIYLREVIVGAGNQVSKGKILQALGEHHNGISILKARPAFDAFQIIEDEAGFAGD
jgi:Protein of unknown function (DUF2971)